MTTTTITPTINDYLEGRKAAGQGWTFTALLEGAMRLADSDQIEVLKAVYPNVYEDLMDRYNAQNTRVLNDMC